MPTEAVNGYFGETSLHLACEHDATAALSVFLQNRRCDARIVNMRDFYGFTPFLVAVNAERLGNFGLLFSYAYFCLQHAA